MPGASSSLHHLPLRRLRTLRPSVVLLALTGMLSIVLTSSKAAVVVEGSFRIGAMFPLYKTGSSSPPFAEDRSGMHRFAAMRLAIEEVSQSPHTPDCVVHSLISIQPFNPSLKYSKLEESPHTCTHTHTRQHTHPHSLPRISNR